MATAGRALCIVTCIGSWSSCGSTEDTIGFNYPSDAGTSGQGGAASSDSTTMDGGAGAIAGAAAAAGDASASSNERTYPNLFNAVLGKTEDEITRKLDANFAQLFHGDPTTESIYVSVGPDQAYVWDPRQMDIRADGFANALLVCVELDHRDEFDRLWRFADAHLVPKTGPLRDYLRSRCDLSGGSCDATVSAESHFAATTALWLAHGRWGSGGSLNYQTEAERLMAAVFRAEPGASTALGELSGLVDAARVLPLASPYASDRNQTSSAAMAAAYFATWAEKSGDPRALELSRHARAYLANVSNASTGLVPDHAAIDGTLGTDDDVFSANSYPVPLAIAVDAVWFGASTWHVDESNRLLSFFSAPLAAKSYAVTYSLSGTAGGPLGDLLSLQAPISACAAAATTAVRADFVQAAWDAKLNTGTSRKFGNLLHMLSSLLLSGRMRVY
ncbi:MAG TPA: glycosyl hydrolase family 8 [Polyangiaceae bacterium]|nr:glycosyl hydrolase family 8 [Polyangiaceae bacterium]